MPDTPVTPANPGSDEPEFSPSGAPIYRYEGVEPGAFELASGDETTIAAISEHIERHLGPVSGVYHELISDKVHLDVYIVAPSCMVPEDNGVTLGPAHKAILWEKYRMAAPAQRRQLGALSSKVQKAYKR